MPKVRKSTNQKRTQWLNSVNDPTLFQVLNDNSLFCRVCGKSFKCIQKSHLTQHESTAEHKIKSQGPLRQKTVKDSLTETNCTFNKDLCTALVAANIPWSKLNTIKLREFLEKYCGRNIPTESTLRKNYLSKCYSETINNIQKKIGNCNIWICVDESTDRTGRYIANIIIGTLDGGPTNSFLLASKVLETTNSVTVARFVNDSLGILWPNGIKYEKVKLLLSDSAAYMLKCGRDLKIFYPTLVHFTCLAHALNLVCEVVRNSFENVNGLIANVKKIFIKAPLRVQHYKSILPNVPLPPEPIITRWSSWLEAALFYAEYFDEIKNVVSELEVTSVSIERALFYINCRYIKENLIYIKANFKILIESIKKLETVDLSMTQALDIVENVKNSLLQSPGEVAKKAVEKLKATLNKNPGYELFTDIKTLLSGGHIDRDIDMNWFIYKYAPLTSCDVERSFSWFKNILTDRRTTFTPEHLEQFFVCNANARN